MSIGIDIGGVLSKYDNDSENDSMDMPGGIESLNRLKELGYDLYIISFCGRRRATKIKEILPKDLFREQFYVKNIKYKSPICNYIGCNFMIDDKFEIFDHLKIKNDSIITILFGNYSGKTYFCYDLR